MTIVLQKIWEGMENRSEELSKIKLTFSPAKHEQQKILRMQVGAN
jgi:hypothetical protein